MAPCPLSLPRPEECLRKFRGPGAFPGRAGSLRPVNEKGGETGQLSRLHGPGEALGWESGHLGSRNASGQSAQHWGRSREAVPRPSKGCLEPGGSDLRAEPGPPWWQGWGHGLHSPFVPAPSAGGPRAPGRAGALGLEGSGAARGGGLTLPWEEGAWSYPSVGGAVCVAAGGPERRGGQESGKS